MMYHFRLRISEPLPATKVTKRLLVSDVDQTFDVMGWFAPCTIKMKILFQKLWEMKVSWDDEVPESVCVPWMKWRSELNLLATKYIPRCYHTKTTSIAAVELHGLSDASERAYAAVVYLRMECTDGSIQISIVSSKTKVEDHDSSS